MRPTGHCKGFRFYTKGFIKRKLYDLCFRNSTLAAKRKMNCNSTRVEAGRPVRKI